MELAIIDRSRAFPYRRGYQMARRVIDVALALLFLPLALPLMALIWLAVRIDSPGSALFIQERIGKGGRPFRMYKFRTLRHGFDDSFHRAFMKAFVNGQVSGGDGDNGHHHQAAFAKAFAQPQFGSNGNGKIYKPIQPSQVTQAGRILRKTSLDELPQIFNVLKGDMSLVGPRPNVPWEVQEYRPWHYRRLEVLPGITGLAQVRGRSGITFDSIVKYDIEYIDNQSLMLDLKILWWTASAILFGEGAS